MSAFLTEIMAHATAILLAGGIGALATWGLTRLEAKRRAAKANAKASELVAAAVKRAQEDQRKHFRQKYEAALPALARSLAKMIMEPIISEKVENQARAIVQTRNEMRDTMTNLHRLLNSEIDRLQTLIKISEKEKTDHREDMMKAIQTLQITWKDGKIEQIQILLRKLLAENGLAEIFDDQLTPA